MKAIVYMILDCPLCQREIERLQAEGIETEIRSMDDLRTGKINDIDAITEAGMAGWEAPLVRIIEEPAHG
ncbi:MAG: hypothetical protein LBU23_13325 [Planctomycetota bacterium]|nr:hypothetical protein [Planctomycetota bacterium]